MTTTPTGVVARLLAMAEDYEKKGAALRLAAEELDERKAATKKNGFHKTVQSAIEVRAAQRPAEPEPMSDEQLHRLVERYLEAQGPSPIRDIEAMLNREGQHMSQTTIRRLLKDMPNAVMHGNFSATRYQLAPVVEPRTKKGPRPILSPYAKQKAERADKRHQVVELLRAAGKPLTTQELRAAAREAGITSLTGIAGYVRKGLIKQTGKRKGHFRYRYVAETAAEPAAS